MRFPPVKVNGQEFLPLRFQSGRGPLHLPDLRSWFGRGSAFYQAHAPLRGFSGIRILTYTWCLRTRQVRNPGLPPRSCSFRLFIFTGYVGKSIPDRCFKFQTNSPIFASGNAPVAGRFTDKERTGAFRLKTFQ